MSDYWERKSRELERRKFQGVWQEQFNYQKEAARTISKDFFPELVNNQEVFRVIEDLLRSGKQLDHIKKALFYGKEMPSRFGINDPQSNLEKLEPIGQLIHSIFGIVTESIELLECLQTLLKNGIEDTEHIKEELGDLSWFHAFCCTVLDCSLEEVQKANIEKLKKRYPEKFTCEHAIKRLDKLDENI